MPAPRSRLVEQWMRLFAAAGPAPSGGTGADRIDDRVDELVDEQGRVRALVLTLSHPADWSLIGRVWRGVQADLGLPAPAIAVNGVNGFELWFSLAEPCPADLAEGFLSSLCARYLCDVEPHRIRCWPGRTQGGEPLPAPLPVPFPQAASGNWSAFVSPDLAPVFADTPWLDIPPGEEAQASLLSHLISASLADLQRTLAPTPTALPSLLPPASPGASPAASPASSPAASHHTDPRQFLLAVMNDEGVELAQRIEAARVLLAHPG